MISRVWSSCLRSRKEEERVHEEDKQTESNESSQLRNETEANGRSKPERNKQHSKTTHTETWHDAQSSMMHVRFNEAWYGKVQQTTLQIKWSSICNEVHIDETPHQLFRSLSVM